MTESSYRRIKPRTVAKWAAGVGLSGTLIFLLFQMLFAQGELIIHYVSGDVECLGSQFDLCIATVIVEPTKDIFLYPGDDELDWMDQVPFWTEQPIKSITFKRSWGASGRTINMSKGCTGSWCGCYWCRTDQHAEYVIVLREHRNYTLIFEVEKENPMDTVKWGFGDVDPFFLPVTGGQIEIEGLCSDYQSCATTITASEGYILNETYNQGDIDEYTYTVTLPFDGTVKADTLEITSCLARDTDYTQNSTLAASWYGIEGGYACGDNNLPALEFDDNSYICERQDWIATVELCFWNYTCNADQCSNYQWYRHITYKQDLGTDGGACTEVGVTGFNSTAVGGTARRDCRTAGTEYGDSTGWTATEYGISTIGEADAHCESVNKELGFYASSGNINDEMRAYFEEAIVQARYYEWWHPSFINITNTSNSAILWYNLSDDFKGVNITESISMSRLNNSITFKSTTPFCLYLNATDRMLEEAPDWSQVEVNDSTPIINNPVHISSIWTTTDTMDDCVLHSNATGVWQDEGLVSISSDTCNFTFTVPTAALGAVVGYNITGNSTFGVYNTTSIYTFEVEGISYTSLGQNLTTVADVAPVLFYAFWVESDNSLEDYWVEHNVSGSFANTSYTSFPSGTEEWSNVTIGMDVSSPPDVTWWRLWANNTAGNTRNTPYGYVYVGNTLTLYINGTSANDDIEYGQMVNITASIDANIEVCLSMDHPDYGHSFSCGDGNIEFEWDTSSVIKVLNDSSIASNLTFASLSNETVWLDLNAEDELLYCYLNLTGHDTGSGYPQNVTVFVNGSLSNQLYGPLQPGNILLQSFNDSDTAENFTFASPAVGLEDYISLPYGSAIASAYLNVTGYPSGSDDPENNMILIGSTKIWNYTTSPLNVVVRTDDFASTLTSALSYCTPDSTGYCTITLFIYQNVSSAILQIDDIDITYSVDSNPIELNISFIQDFLDLESGTSDMPIVIQADEGNVEVGGINCSYLGTAMYNLTAYSFELSDQQNLSVFYSKFSVGYPSDLPYWIFRPDTVNSTGVIPTGQSSTVPVFNISALSYDRGMSVSVYWNTTDSDILDCTNITFSTCNDKGGCWWDEDWESGAINSTLWTVKGSPGTYNRTQLMTATPSPANGTYSLRMDVDTNNNYENNILVTKYDFSDAAWVKLEFWVIESGEEVDTCSNTASEFPNCDGVFYTCAGDYWYEVWEHPDNIDAWTYVNVDVGHECSEINSSFAIKFSQYDNYAWNADGLAWDDINITWGESFTFSNSSQTMISNLTLDPSIGMWAWLDMDQCDDVIVEINEIWDTCCDGCMSCW